MDLILLDVLMPQMDGYETLKRLRQDRKLRKVPVIMITGIDDRANIASFLRAGVDDYVLKPLVLPELQVRALALGGPCAVCAVHGRRPETKIVQRVGPNCGPTLGP